MVYLTKKELTVMNYAAKVSGAGNQAYGKFGGGCGGYGGTNAAWFLVLFILLVIIIACVL